MSTDPHPLDEYARRAAERLGTQTECSILLREHHLLTYVGSSSERAALCDKVEVATGEGPCVTAIQELRHELVADVRADTRWPEWRRTALDVGFRSAVALPGVVDDETTVVLNLYSEAVDRWERAELLATDALVQEMAEAIRTGLIEGRLHW